MPHESPPAQVRPSLEDQLLAQVARMRRKMAESDALTAELGRRLRRVSEVAASVLADHAKYHLQAVDVADRVRRALAPPPVRRTSVYRPAPGAPPADPTRLQAMPPAPPKE